VSSPADTVQRTSSSTPSQRLICLLWVVLLRVTYNYGQEPVILAITNAKRTWAQIGCMLSLDNCYSSTPQRWKLSKSIDKIFIVNRFNVTLHILSPKISLKHNIFWDGGCVVLREIDFIWKIADWFTRLSSLWRLVTWVPICASLNHRKKKRIEPCPLISRKLIANLELQSSWTTASHYLIRALSVGMCVVETRAISWFWKPCVVRFIETICCYLQTWSPWNAAYFWVKRKTDRYVRVQYCILCA